VSAEPSASSPPGFAGSVTTNERFSKRISPRSFPASSASPLLCVSSRASSLPASLVVPAALLPVELSPLSAISAASSVSPPTPAAGAAFSGVPSPWSTPGPASSDPRRAWQARGMIRTSSNKMMAARSLLIVYTWRDLTLACPREHLQGPGLRASDPPLLLGPRQPSLPRASSRGVRRPRTRILFSQALYVGW
jgi:hypothetical protein